VYLLRAYNPHTSNYVIQSKKSFFSHAVDGQPEGDSCAGIMGAKNRSGIGLLGYTYSLAGLYDNLVPSRFIAPIDRSKIPALDKSDHISFTLAMAQIRENNRIFRDFANFVNVLYSTQIIVDDR
jgi:hypothetical protein